MEGEQQTDGNNGASSMLEEAQQREAASGTADVLEGIEQGTAPPRTVGTSATGPRKTKSPSQVLVCTDCKEYYKQKENWKYCPKCADQLVEVQKA